ncbi:MAG: CRTAC1 family protein [Pirellulaceae bacterium]
MTSRTWSTRTWVVAALLVIAAIGGVLFSIYALRPGPDVPSVENADELNQAKNVGLGYLENQKLTEARQAFELIAADLPADPLAARNIAVARVLALGIDYEPAPQPDIDAAQAALAAARMREGESLALHWLALRISVAERDFSAAEAHLAAIVAAEPNDPAAWYTLFRILRLADPQESAPAAIEALERAFELSPANAWLLVEWLRATATRLSDELNDLPEDETQRAAALAALQTKYASLAEQLVQARPAAQPFAHVIQTHVGVDVLALFDEAATAARQNDLATAATRMRMLANVLLPHAAPDQQPLRRHPLEFVLDRFAPEFYQQAQLAEASREPAIAVTFANTDGWQLPAALAEDLGEIRDLALADFDLDGRLDLFALGEQTVGVYGRSADADPWKLLASAAAQGASRLLVQDLDNDFDETRFALHGNDLPATKPAGSPALKNGCPSADVDVALFGKSAVVLLENRVDQSTSQRSLIAVVGEKLPTNTIPVRRLTCADLEADGDLDLILATDEGLKLWANAGEWTFTDISARSRLPENLGEVSELVAFDWDRDVDIDCLVAAAGGGGWLENLRHGQFRWRPFAREIPLLDWSRSLAPLEADGNANWDLLAAGEDGINYLAGPVDAKIADAAANRLMVWDYDNDGWDDFLALSADRVQLYRGLGEGQFQAVDLLGGAPAASQADLGDLDLDGDLDLVLLVQGRIQFRENEGGNQNHWLDVALQAQQIKGDQHSPSGRVSPYGVGSLLELKAGTRYQARIVSGQTTHFGLGQRAEADVVRVGWLNGVPQNIIRPAADLFVCEQQVLNTSCPYLYAWNGERFEFVTDLLWNAPLGLQLAEGVLAKDRAWEYLKIPGEALVARDGEYWLQVTAELWEADYFDEVRLIAIDHPADVEIFSNEKVGPAEIAEYKIHTASQPRLPLAARNHASRDLLADISKQDGVYAQAFDRKLRQGVVEEHSLELELGDLSGAKRVTLFLTGWVFPASTSINVALSQGGSIQPPRPPSLEISDGLGGWQPALPFMGFPGGKTKTIAIELPVEQFAENFEPGTLNSVRIRTSMELYWDHIFFTVDEPAVEVRTSELKLVSANLHARGYSRVVPDSGNGPERFLYDELSTIAKWPPMLGRFTRLGDVRQLLAASDDRLLVMGAGDETTLRFAVPPAALPAGWKRDFFLYNVGWDKDANLETILGQAVEPLPWRSMSAYPWPDDEKAPDSDAYRAYLDEFQTREETSAYWRAISQWNEAARAPR